MYLLHDVFLQCANNILNRTDRIIDLCRLQKSCSCILNIYQYRSIPFTDYSSTTLTTASMMSSTFGLEK